jgi:glycosyltransferase involved in cell wall biosynthesis
MEERSSRSGATSTLARAAGRGATPESSGRRFRPVWVGEAELGEPLAVRAVLAPPRPEHEEALVLVRLHSFPLGFSRLALAGGRLPELKEIAELLAADHAVALAAHRRADGVAAPVADAAALLGGLGTRCARRELAVSPGFSIVLCTRDRPELAGRALAQLRRLAYPRFEVLLVDNAPRDGATREAFARVAGDDGRFRYVVEDRPGLSRARNRGLAEARHRLVAFTDDDARADPHWLEALARGFARHDNVACVTGLVPSAQLDTPAQHYFHERVWWGSALEPRTFWRERQAADPPLHPFRIGNFGTGANFAVDRDLARRLGGFSELIGAGSPCRGGAEDGDMFVRVLQAGRALAYEPSAIIWHRARPTDAELRAQLEEYGRGIFVTGLKWLADPALRPEVLRRLPAALTYYLALIWRRGYGGEAERAPMALAELRATLSGPSAFVRGYLQLRREEAAGGALSSAP